MAVDRVARASLDLSERTFELVVRKGLDLAAVVAHEVMVVFAVGVNRLEARRAGSDVDSLHEAVAAELLEDAVDARDPDMPAGGTEPVEDLLRREAAVLAAE